MIPNLCDDTPSGQLDKILTRPAILHPFTRPLHSRDAEVWKRMEERWAQLRPKPRLNGKSLHPDRQRCAQQETHGTWLVNVPPLRLFSPPLYTAIQVDG